MNTILFCSFVFLSTLVSANAQTTFADIYNRYLEYEHEQTDACRKENNLSKEMVQAVVISLSDNGVVPDRREYKCFLTCMMLKSKSINEKGELILENVRAQSEAVHINFLEKSMFDCLGKINETDFCEKGARIEICFSEEVKIQLNGQNK